VQSGKIKSDKNLTLIELNSYVSGSRVKIDGRIFLLVLYLRGIYADFNKNEQKTINASTWLKQTSFAQCLFCLHVCLSFICLSIFQICVFSWLACLINTCFLLSYLPVCLLACLSASLLACLPRFSFLPLYASLLPAACLLLSSLFLLACLHNIQLTTNQCQGAINITIMKRASINIIGMTSPLQLAPWAHGAYFNELLFILQGYIFYPYPKGVLKTYNFYFRLIRF